MPLQAEGGEGKVHKIGFPEISRSAKMRFSKRHPEQSNSSAIADFDILYPLTWSSKGHFRPGRPGRKASCGSIVIYIGNQQAE